MDQVTVNGTADNEISSVFSSTGVTGISGTSAPVTIFHAETGDQLVVNSGAATTRSMPQAFRWHSTLTLDGGLSDGVLFGGQASELMLGAAGNDVYLKASPRRHRCRRSAMNSSDRSRAGPM